jgi:hypothetical protein
VETSGKLRLSAKQPFSYSFHWLREVVFGVIEGDLGLTIEPACEASVEYTASGTYRQQLALDEQGRLRLQVLNRRTKDLDLAAGLSVSVRAVTPLPEKPESLLAAILGIHEQQWLKSLSKFVESAPSAVKDLIPQVAAPLVQKFLEYWNGLEPALAAKLWESAEKSDLLRSTVGNVLTQQRFAAVLKGLKEYAMERLLPEKVLKGLESLTGCQALDPWVRSQIEALAGPIRSEADVARVLENVRTAIGLRDSIYSKAAAALEKKYSAELSISHNSAEEETALVDCSFDFTDEGLALFRRAWSGDYAWLLSASREHAEVRSGVFTHRLSRETRIELHLPFLDRKQWSTRLEALARMEVAVDDDGRLLVYHVEASHRVASKNTFQSVLALAGGLSVGRVHSSSSFTLSYSDTRRLQCARASVVLEPVIQAYKFDAGAIAGLLGQLAAQPGDLDVSLTLTIPGSLVAAWLDAPGERDPLFFPAYARVATAVQRALRAWLPYTYFSSLDRYETLEAAFPLIVYQASRPFFCKPKYDFNYDVMSETSMNSFFRLAAQRLPQDLACIEGQLAAGGREGTAAFYSPKQARAILASVRRRPRLLHSLLVADAFLIDALVNLGCRGSQLRRESASDPAAAVKSLCRFAADFVKAFHGRLKRLYGGQEFLALGSLLLVEATSALQGDAGGPREVPAVLRISRQNPTESDTSEEILVNPAYRLIGG